MTWDVCDRIRKPCAQGKPPAQALGGDLGAIIGFIGLQHSFPGSAIIRAIAVAPTYRGQGIGSRLLRQSIETITLSHVVAETDSDAVEFYRRCGFTISSLGEKYSGTERFLCSWAV